MAATDPFVARAGELNLLDAAYNQASAGSPRAALVEGDAGIGKSALLRRFVSRLPADVRVVWGRAHLHAGTPAYWPWIEILRQLTARPSTAQTRVLGQLSGEQRAAVGDAIRLATAPDDPQAAQFRLFDEVVQFLIAAAQSEPLVVIFEDLQWADPASLRLLAHLAAVADGSLLLLGAYRSGETESEAYPQLIEALTHMPGFEHIRLTGLERNEIEELLLALTDRAPAPSVVAICAERTSGNPLFIREVGLALAAAPADQQPRMAAALVPANTRESIRNRIATLSELDRVTVIRAAILGVEFPVEVLGALVEREIDVVLESLDRLRAGRILDLGDRPGEFRFHHAIVRDAILDSLGAIERSREHARVASRLETYWESDLDRHAAALAEHFARGFESNTELRQDVAHYARLAAEAAEAAFAWDDAAAQYTRLLSAVSDAAGNEALAEILLRLGRCHRVRGDSGAAGETLLAAYRHYQSIGDSEGMASAALLGARIGVSWTTAETLAILDETIAVNRGEDERRLAFLLGRRAWEVFGFDDASNGAAAEAAALAEKLELLPIVSDLLDRDAHQALHEARFDAVPALSIQRFAVTERLEDWEEASHALAEPLIAALADGDLQAAKTAGQRALAYAEDHGVELWVHMDRLFLASVLNLQGDIAGTDELIEQVPLEYAALPRGILVADRVEHLNKDDAIAILEEQRSAVPPEATLEHMRGAYVGTWARLLWRTGRSAEAARTLDEWQQITESQPAALWRVGSLAAVEGVLAALGAEPLLRQTYEDLLAHDARVSFLGRPLDQVRGELALRLGDQQAAQRHFQRGLSWAREQHSRQVEGHAHLGLATVARAEGDQERSAQEMSLARSYLPDSTAPETGLHPLTNRETDVVALIARGMSNRAIASELGISATTVATHVSNILNKTALTNRTEVAAHANRLLPERPTTEPA